MTDSKEHILGTKSNTLSVNVLLVWILQSRGRGTHLAESVASKEIRIYVFTVHTSISTIMLLTVSPASCTTVLEYFTEGFVHSDTQYFKVFGLIFRVLLVNSILQLATFCLQAKSPVLKNVADVCRKLKSATTKHHDV
jgi:hypothetical protein